jgi:hypothetical protein
MADNNSPPDAPLPLPRGAILGGALAVGVAGNLFLYGSDAPGLNLLLMFVVLASAIATVSRAGGLRLSREAFAWLATGLLFAAAFVLRAAPPLHFLAFLAASATFAFPGLQAGAGWLRRSGVGDHLEAIVGAVIHSGFGSLRLLVETVGGSSVRGAGSPDGAATPAEAAPRSRTGAILRGLLLATPLLLLFGALFMSADQVFRGIVTNAFEWVALEDLAGRIIVMVLLTWLASGYLAGFATGTGIRRRLERAVSRPSLGIVEGGTALGLVNLLFAAFVLVQLRYLFGGSALVEVTPGLTYSEYAREGFAQLVVASGLVLPLLLLSDWLLRREGPRDNQIFRVLGGIQLVLLVVVIASAFQRVRVYQEAYGLTESRFYGSAFLVWLALVCLWMGATVLSGRRERFASVALISGFALVAGLLVANPDERIAGANLARTGEFDAAYLASLSADAVPTIVRSLPNLPPEPRATLSEELRRRWGAEARGDWRSWNLSEARARRLVREEVALSGCSRLRVAAPVGAPRRACASGTEHRSRERSGELLPIDHQHPVHQEVVHPLGVPEGIGEGRPVREAVRIEDHQVRGHARGDQPPVVESQAVRRK